MPIVLDIMKDKVIGPLIRQGRAEGQLEMLTDQIGKRFGAIPPQIRKRLATLRPAQVKAASLRLRDASRIEDIFPR